MRTFPEVPKIKWRRYRTATALVRAFFPKNHPTALAVGTDGSEVTLAQLAAEARGMGCWAFTDTKRRVIHWWSDGRRSEGELIHLFTHELGHNLGRPNKRSIFAEENRAEQYSWAAEESIRKARKILERGSR